jgi:sec-independent protein translocase protein TatB
MPTIGWFEILIVVAVAIVVIGPKDFPFMLKKTGSWIGTVKKYISNVQNEVADLDLDNIHLEEAKIEHKHKDKDKDNDKI